VSEFPFGFSATDDLDRKSEPAQMPQKPSNRQGFTEVTVLETHLSILDRS
jgi:hypothetical protein